MYRCLLLFLLAIFVSFATCTDPEIEEEELRGRDFMAYMNKENEQEAHEQMNAEWNYATNITEENMKRKTELAAKSSDNIKRRWQELQKIDWRSFSDPSLRRMFMSYSILGGPVLSKEEILQFAKLAGEMEKVFSTATICDYKNKTKCDIALNPDIFNIMRESRDEKELKYVWLEYRNAIGPHVRHLYRDYVHLSNKVAHLNGFNSTDLMWLFAYEENEIKDMKSQFRSLWEQVRPLYQQLHAYIRFKLRGVYGDGVVSERGPIPAHLLGHIHAQSWGDIAEDYVPYSDVVKADVTKNLKRQNYTVEKMFRTAEDFFISIGLSPMLDSFWKKSLFIKPKDRDVICHASSWDFQTGDDFRIKMCASVTEEDFYVVHHEMGHIEYSMEYKDQPFQFRAGANPGFHEAIGNVISLSVLSAKHLKKLGLSSAPDNDAKVILNNLFTVGMKKIAFLPFAYLLDEWRWGVFSGKIPYEHYNCKWWELKESVQGLEPPVPRTETDFDPASIYHISAGMPYIRYFVASILEFQIHRALCEKAGEYDPNDPQKHLYTCDIYQNKEAGKLLKKILRMGASKPWPEVLYVATGQRNMDASALLEYFHPLQSWLEKENRKNKVHIGWEKSSKGCGKVEES